MIIIYYVRIQKIYLRFGPTEYDGELNSRNLFESQVIILFGRIHI